MNFPRLPPLFLPTSIVVLGTHENFIDPIFDLIFCLYNFCMIRYRISKWLTWMRLTNWSYFDRKCALSLLEKSKVNLIDILFRMGIHLLSKIWLTYKLLFVLSCNINHYTGSLVINVCGNYCIDSLKTLNINISLSPPHFCVQLR